MTRLKTGLKLLALGPLLLTASLFAVNCGGGNATNDSACSACSGCGGCGCGGGKIDGALVTQPEGFKPNAGDLDDAALLARGKELWKDDSIGKKGITCISCHPNATANFKSGFAEDYPHHVVMAEQKSGIKKLSAAEMVQFCMLAPMQGDTLKWESVDLAALTRAVIERQKEYREATK